jgi:hypothetical protein
MIVESVVTINPLCKIVFAMANPLQEEKPLKTDNPH